MISSSSSLETLPDEILLQVCSYLYGSEVLYSLYNVNARLNVAITGYCHYVNIMGLTYHQVNHVVSHILPQIASSIRSFVFNGWREKLLPSKLFTSFDAAYMAFSFPRIQKITFEPSSVSDFLLFIDALHNVPQLVELNIRSLRGYVNDEVLLKVLAANNNRLQSVSFDEDSVSLIVPPGDQLVPHLNIQTLEVLIKESRMLSNLLALIPNVNRLYVSIDQYSEGSRLKSIPVNLPPLTRLINFHLCSVDAVWTLDELADILRLMPSLQTLTLDLCTKDERLVNQPNFLMILPSCLKQICFLIRYYFDESVVDIDSLTHAWSASLPISCLLDEIERRLLIFTTSSGLHTLNLPASVGRQIQRGCKYTQRVSNLHICAVESLLDLLSTLQHFHRLCKLRIDASHMTDTSMVLSSKQVPMLHLPHLKELNISGVCAILDMLKASPSLDDLIIDFECLKFLIDDKATCDLLGKQITHLKLYFQSDIQVDCFHLFVSVLHCLRRLTLVPTNGKLSSETLSTILTRSNIEQLTILIIERKIFDENNENLQQWVIDHTHLTTNDLFTVANVDEFFILWK